MTASDSGMPRPSAELVQIVEKIVGKRYNMADVLRAWEILYGHVPDTSRPAAELAEEIVAAVNLMAPDKDAQPSTRTMLEVSAANGKAMTVGELAQFLTDVRDAAGAVVPAAMVQPKVRISFGGGIKSIKAEVRR